MTREDGNVNLVKKRQRKSWRDIFLHKRRKSKKNIKKNINRCDNGSKLKTLVIMQLKDKLDYHENQSLKTKLFKVIYIILKFAIITAIIYFGFYLLSKLHLIDLMSGIPDRFLLVLFTLMTTLSILSCTMQLVKALYYAKDNRFLLTTPTNRVNIFFSKLIVFYIYELLRNMSYILPVLIAFGLVNKFAFYFYMWIMIGMLWFTGVTVLTAALLSIPAMYIGRFLSRFKLLQYILVLAGVAVGIYAVVSLINLIPQNFNIVESWGTTFWDIQHFMDNFYRGAVPFAWLMESLVGSRYGVSHSMFYGRQWLILLGAILFIALMMFLCYVILRPLFFSIASSPFEYKKIIVKKAKKNKRMGSFLSAVKNQFLLYIRTTEKWELAGIALLMPIAILLLNRIFNAMNTRLAGTYMSITFNMLMISLFSLSSNTVVAKIYSEEGNSSYLSKINPKPYFITLFAKLIPNIVIMTLSIFVTVIIFGHFAKSFVSTPLVFLVIESLYLGHLLWSAELDIMNPQIMQYASTGTHTNNPNENKSTFIMFMLSFIVAALTYFLIGEGATFFWMKMAGLGLIFFAIRFWMYYTKIKVYYKEIV